MGLRCGYHCAVFCLFTASKFKFYPVGWICTASTHCVHPTDKSKLCDKCLLLFSMFFNKFNTQKETFYIFNVLYIEILKSWMEIIIILTVYPGFKYSSAMSPDCKSSTLSTLSASHIIMTPFKTTELTLLIQFARCPFTVLGPSKA